jgi:uncharacterized repeat protein (TIGR03803 family)
MTKRATIRRLLLATLTILTAHVGRAQGASFETLYSFLGSPDGANPLGGVLIGTGEVLYGTTSNGGASDLGTVFELTPAKSGPWTETVLHNFSGPDGSNSAATLVFGLRGALYGTTPGGGSGSGTVFELAPPSTAGGAWTETVLYTLGGGDYRSQNHIPNGTLAVGPGGTLYTATQGTASPLGEQYGTVDAMTPPATPGGAWTGYVIYDIEVIGSPAGLLPLSGVMFDGKSLFGTTYYAGYVDGDCIGVGGCGAVYELTPPASPGAWTATGIHDFTGSPNDGGGSVAALTLGSSGLLYGTTSFGGSGACSTVGGVIQGCGVVFQLKPPATSGGTWAESVIYSFTGVNGDGATPVASVFVGASGVLYGTTENGGTATSTCPATYYVNAGCGTVFELTPPTTPGGAWTETVLHSFSGLTDGSLPVAGLTLSKAGVLYGTTSAGGASGQGTVFAIKP